MNNPWKQQFAQLLWSFGTTYWARWSPEGVPVDVPDGALLQLLVVVAASQQPLQHTDTVM
jgi:uncharacterized membrane protein